MKQKEIADNLIKIADFLDKQPRFNDGNKFWQGETSVTISDALCKNISKLLRVVAKINSEELFL